jgi:hypothetical protein
MHTAAERTAGRNLISNALQHGFQCWYEVDPKRPLFQRWLSTTKKLLGDNPDAVYYGAVADPAGTYRIRGNVHGACYTSFSVETGAQEGNLSKGVISTLNDTEFDIAADGSYEIIASPDPQPRNWLRLEPGAGSITTRHYWEWERSVAADPTFHVPLWIEPVEDPGPAPPMDDAAVAAGIRRVINFVRGATIDFPDLPPEVMPAWVSSYINQFDNSDYSEDNTEIGYAAADNAYLQCRYELDPDQALVMRGAVEPSLADAPVPTPPRLDQSQPDTLRKRRQLQDRRGSPGSGRAELDRRCGAANWDGLLALPAARRTDPEDRSRSCRRRLAELARTGSLTWASVLRRFLVA